MSPDHAIAIATQDGFEDDPIDPTWIVSGDPRARAKDLSAGTKGRTRVALWECSAGEFDWHYDVDETVHFLEGQAHLRGQDGIERTVRAGDVVLFHKGSSVHWVIPEKVRKLAVLHDVRSPARRLAHAVLRRLRD